MAPTRLRQAVLQLLTAVATVTLLAALTVPAVRALRAVAEATVGKPARVVTPAPAARPLRLFGVYVDPWHVDDWSRGVGAAPQALGHLRGVLAPPDAATLPGRGGPS